MALPTSLALPQWYEGTAQLETREEGQACRHHLMRDQMVLAHALVSIQMSEAGDEASGHEDHWQHSHATVHALVVQWQSRLEVSRQALLCAGARSDEC